MTDLIMTIRELLGLHEVISCSSVMTSSSCEAGADLAKKRLR